MTLYSNSETLMKHLQDWADSWDKEPESEQKNWTLTAIDYFMRLVKITATAEFPSYTEIRAEALDDLLQEAKEWAVSFNAAPTSSIFFTINNIQKIAEKLKNE